MANIPAIAIITRCLSTPLFLSATEHTTISKIEAINPNALFKRLKAKHHRLNKIQYAI